MSRGPLWNPERIESAAGPESLDAAIARLPNRPAVFLIWPREGPPYLGKTSMLRRRLERLLGVRQGPSKRLNLRSVASHLEYRLTASWLETSLVLHAAARRHFPESYLDHIRLRMPPYVKVVLANAYPRTQVTSRVGDSHAFYYGPFRTRAAAEAFESRVLDFFQMRRCQENLEPSSVHPGCMYGEMNMCLRPCQLVVSAEEYRSEVERVVRFLATNGRSLLDSLVDARNRLSAEMSFEEAARLHKQIDRIEQALKLRDELAGNVETLNGVAVTRSVAPGCVELWFLLRGSWHPPHRFVVQAAGGKTESLDHRLRTLAAALGPEKVTARERQEHLALLARWFYSSYRDGEWIPFAALDDVPYRKLVRAISRQGQ